MSQILFCISILTWEDAMKAFKVLSCMLITAALVFTTQCKKSGMQSGQQIVESQEIKNYLLGKWEVFSSGKIMEAVESMYSRDPHLVMIGTDPSEWLRGYDAIMEIFKLEEKMGRFLIHTDKLEAYQKGDMGWALGLVTLTMPDGSKLQLRETFLFQKEGGTWKIINEHASIGVGNEQVGFILPAK
jgi:ketosteroid isomerase-like protein